MRTLQALWELSLALCMIAMLALLILLVARLVAGRLVGTHAIARQDLLVIMLDGDSTKLEPLKGLQLKVATELTIELAEMTRGSDRDVLLARAGALGVPALLARRLRSFSAQTRLSAAEAIVMFGDYRAEAEMALDDRNADVRLSVALALAQRGEAPAPLTLMHKLKVGSEERSLLLVSLMADLAEQNSEAVAGLLFEPSLRFEVKVAAMDALANRGGEYALLLAYMARNSAGEPELQPRIFRALGRTGHPAGGEAILLGLSNESWTVRASAAEAAGKAGLTHGADKLGELLGDPNYWVRYRASEALLRLGPRGINALREAADGDDDLGKATATTMLSEGRAA